MTLVGMNRLSHVLASEMWSQLRDAPFEKHKDTKPKKTLYSRIVDSNNHFHHVVLTHLTLTTPPSRFCYHPYSPDEDPQARSRV